MDFRKRFPLRLWRPDVGDEVDAELEFHLAMRQRELMAQGMTEAQARRAALDRFGDYRRARRECRAIGFQRERRMRLFQYLSELRQDAAFSVRQMLAAPGFTLVAVATLALGIGATTAIFSAVHAVVLRPLPLADPDALVMVESGWREGRMSVAPAHYLHMAEEQTAFAAVAAVAWANFTLAREDGAERVVGARVTGQYFDVLGVPPALGGVFGDAHDQPGREDVVVLSHRLWTRLFGADPAIVGRAIPVNQRPHTVLGVMPPSLDFSDTSEELWVPMAFTAEERERRGNHYLSVYARLRDGVSVRQADEQMNLMVARRLERWPDESPERTMHATSLMDVYVGRRQTPDRSARGARARRTGGVRRDLLPCSLTRKWPPPGRRRSGLPAAADRLDSWKDIAAYLRKAERTVRRWKRTEGLPIHRQHHACCPSRPTWQPAVPSTRLCACP